MATKVTAMKAYVNDCTVKLDLVAKGYYFPMSFNTNDPIYAALLADSFNESIRRGIRAVREEAYNAGWQDAKAKRRKADWFSSYVEMNDGG